MVTIHHDTEWLIELLRQNKFINIGDGLNTFVVKTSKGWKICGRDDVMVILRVGERTFDDLSFALNMDKSLKRRFLRTRKQNNKENTS